MGGLRIVTYNCRGIKSSLPVIHELCTDNGVVLLQETLLCSHNLHFINSIHSDLYVGGCTSVDALLTCLGCLRRRTRSITNERSPRCSLLRCCHGIA